MGISGGKNRYGESALDTLKREWHEELSVAIEVGELITSFDFENNGVIYHLRCYLVRAKSRDFVLKEHLALRFVDKKELLVLPFGDSDSRIRDYLIQAKILL